MLKSENLNPIFEINNSNFNDPTSESRIADRRAWDSGSPTQLTPRILLVDDDPLIVEVLTIGLETYFRVSVARSVQEARERLAEHRFAVVLLDWELPDGMGSEFIKHNAQQPPSVPVILLTARSGIASHMKETMKHIEDYIPKPFVLNDVVTRINRVIRTPIERARLRDLEERIGGSAAVARLGDELTRQRRDPFIKGVEFKAPAGWRAWGHLEEVYCLGGDVLEEIEFSSGGIGYVIADVCGKGITAGAVSSLLRATFLSLAPRASGPSELLRMVNERWRNLMPRHFLVTAIVIGFDSVGFRRLCWSSAGHPFPRVRLDGQWTTFEEDSPMLGLFDRSEYADRDTELGPEDCFCAFSDGAFEVTDAAGQMLDEAGLYEILDVHLRKNSLRVAIPKIRATIRGLHEGRPAADDLALLIIGRESIAEAEDRLACPRNI